MPSSIGPRRQPDGFESLFSAHESLAEYDRAVPHRPYLPDIPAGLYAALLAATSDSHADRHLVSRIDALADHRASTVELI